MQKIVRTVVVAALLVASCLLCAETHAQAKWSGVDEAVVEKIAREHGREARPPLINTDRGDLLLFAFFLAGTGAGFAAGYYWRRLTERRRRGES